MKKVLPVVIALLAVSSCVTTTESAINSLKSAKKLVPVEKDDVRTGVRYGEVIAYLHNEDFSLQLFSLGKTEYHLGFFLGIINNSRLAPLEIRLSDFQLEYIEPEKQEYLEAGYEFYKPKNEPGTVSTLNCLYENQYILPFIDRGYFNINGVRGFLNRHYYKNHDLAPGKNKPGEDKEGEYKGGVISFYFYKNPAKNVTVKLKINGKNYAVDFREVSEYWFPEKSVAVDHPLMNSFPENIEEFIIDIKQ